MPSHVTSRMTVFTPSTKVRAPSGETSHVRALSPGRSMCQNSCSGGGLESPESALSTAAESPVSSTAVSGAAVSQVGSGGDSGLGCAA